MFRLHSSSFHTNSAPSGEMQAVTAAKKIQLLQLLLKEETYKETQCDCCHWGLYCRTHPHEAFPKCNAFKSEVGALNDLFLWWKRQMPWSEVSHAQIYSPLSPIHRLQAEPERKQKPHPTTSRQFPCFVISKRFRRVSLSQTQWLMGLHKLQGHISTLFR